MQLKTIYAPEVAAPSRLVAEMVDSRGNVVSFNEIAEWIGRAKTILGYEPVNLCAQILTHAGRANVNSSSLRAALFDLALKHLHFGESVAFLVVVAYADGYIAGKTD